MNEINYREFIENNFYIVDKNSKKRLLKFNSAQVLLYNAFVKTVKEGLPRRLIILKGRQMGISTLIVALMLAYTILNENVKSGIITHLDRATKNLFTMAKRYFNNLKSKPSTSASNAFEIVFDLLDGKIACMTASNEGVGRSDTYMFLHLSEFALWQCDVDEVYTALMQSAPLDAFVFIESTAYGYNHFKDMWDGSGAEGEMWNGFTRVFCPWFMQTEYRIPAPYDMTLSVEEEKLKEKYNLDNDQLYWRRFCIRSNCKGSLNKFKQEYPCYPEEAFLFSGKSIFDMDKVVERIGNVKPIKRRGFYKYELGMISEENRRYIKSYEWVESAKGLIEIYEEPRVEVIKNSDKTEKTMLYPYVLGGDPAGEGSDYFSGYVLDNTNGEMVASVYVGKIQPFEYAIQLYCLGKDYHNALLGVETNYQPTTMNVIQELGYPNLYVRQTMDSVSNQLQDKLGFRTTFQSRNTAVGMLVEYVSYDIDKINHKQFLNECETFVSGDDGKAQAVKGKHDDCVMGLAITLFIRNSRQQVYLPYEDIKEEEEINFLKENFSLNRKEESKGDEYITW